MKKINLVLLFAIFIAQYAFAQRDTISLNDDWKFSIDQKSEGITQKWFAKNIDGETVQVPHTWQVDQTHQMYYGWAWYQKSLPAPAQWKNKHLMLQFEAINHTAEIYLNGKKIAEHIGDGFSKFKISLDGKLKYGGNNTITVAVNNAYNNTKVPFGSSFDWANDGGIIRPVSLIVANAEAADELHLLPKLNLADSSASLKISVKGTQLKANESYQMALRISEENQNTHEIIFTDKVKTTWQNGALQAEIQLPKVHPWHFDFPNLYHINVVLMKNNIAIDQIADNTGFRTTELKNGKFYLNGEAIKLMGVEWTAGSNPDFGFAEPEAFIRKMGDRMKEVNCIFSRQHFQQSDVFYDFCDRKGIIVQQEIPLWGGETPSTPDIKNIAMSQIDEMIGNFYNHPSIFSWGVGNELRGRDPEMKQMIKDMLARVRSLDPDRHAAYVSNTLTHGYFNDPKFVPDAANDGDYLMMNEYGAAWWTIPAGQIGKYLDSVHLSYPDKPFFISEFGLCGPNFKGGDPRRIQDLIYHMSLYESKPYVEGAIYFDLTDYRTHYPGTTEKNKYRRRVHGIYDMYGNPKPSMAVLREQSSPVEVQGFSKADGGKASVLLFGAMGLPEHIVKGYKLYVTDSATNYKDTKAYDIPTLKPGQRMDIKVDDLYQGNAIITIVRPTGYVVFQKSFYRLLPEEEDME